MIPTRERRHPLQIAQQTSKITSHLPVSSTLGFHPGCIYGAPLPHCCSTNGLRMAQYATRHGSADPLEVNPGQMAHGWDPLALAGFSLNWEGRSPYVELRAQMPQKDHGN